MGENTGLASKTVYQFSVITTEKEGRSVVRRTEKSDWAASPASAEIEVCAGAVLPGRRCPEPQALGAVPQPSDEDRSGSYCLNEPRGRKAG